MPRVRFANDDLEIEVPPGTTLSLAAQEASATLGFGCRAGTCGTCADGQECLAEGLCAVTATNPVLSGDLPDPDVLRLIHADGEDGVPARRQRRAPRDRVDRGEEAVVEHGHERGVGRLLPKDIDGPQEGDAAAEQGSQLVVRRCHDFWPHPNRRFEL
mgnify:CR=1 FL=1